VSLNYKFVPANTQLDESYDHVFLNPYHTSEVDMGFGFISMNFVETMADSWAATHTDPFPGNPYEHNAFRAAYSDHNPVIFTLVVPALDDD